MQLTSIKSLVLKQEAEATRSDGSPVWKTQWSLSDIRFDKCQSCITEQSEYSRKMHFGLVYRI